MSLQENYFDEIPDDRKKEVAFNIVVSVRDAISIAQKKQTPPTYEQALRITHDIDENLYNFCSKQLTNKNENDIVKLFKERAEIESLNSEKPKTAIALMEEEVAYYKNLLKTPNIDRDKTKSLKSHIASLEAAIENLKPRKLTEHRILERDFCKIDRSQLGAEKFFETDNYVDYRIGNNKFLRIRLLHPDKAEHILGADLIYEQYNVELEQLRMVLLQYKTWEDGVLYFSSSSNLEAQLQKLRSHICDKQFCQQPSALAGQLDYRFPYCCAFLRPTDKQQNSNNKIISHGIHIPVCSALQIRNEGGNKIEKNQMRHSTLTHEVFENLFNHGFIGSRWLPVAEMEDFYRERKVLDSDQSLKLYAKEILGKKDEFEF